MTFPGTQPVSLRELQTANRRLVSATKRRDRARKALAVAEKELKAARARVRGILELADRQAPAVAPLCPECGADLGTGATCLECSATRAFVAADGGKA